MSKPRLIHESFALSDGLRWTTSLLLALAAAMALGRWLGPPPQSPPPAEPLTLVRLAPPPAAAGGRGRRPPAAVRGGAAQPRAGAEQPKAARPARAVAAPTPESLPPELPPPASLPTREARPLPDEMALVEDPPPPSHPAKQQPAAAAPFPDPPPPPPDGWSTGRPSALTSEGPPAAGRATGHARGRVAKAGGRREVPREHPDGARPVAAARRAREGKRAGGASRAAFPAELDAGFRLMEPVLPDYPERARRLARGGEVRVELAVEPDGSVSEVKVAASPSGWGFGRAARSAYREARFSPPTVGGQAVRVVWRKTLLFRP